MRVLPENKKKQFWSIILLLVCVAGIVYFNFFVGSALPAVSTKPAPAEPAKSTSRAMGEALPYGREIDLSVLGRDEFRVLKAPPPLGISPQELGKTNPFE